MPKKSYKPLLPTCSGCWRNIEPGEKIYHPFGRAIPDYHQKCLPEPCNKCGIDTTERDIAGLTPEHGDCQQSLIAAVKTLQDAVKELKDKLDNLHVRVDAVKTLQDAVKELKDKLDNLHVRVDYVDNNRGNGYGY